MKFFAFDVLGWLNTQVVCGNGEFEDLILDQGLGNAVINDIINVREINAQEAKEIKANWR